VVRRASSGVHCDSLEERLFVLALLGDDRAIAATYSAGRCVWAKLA
jgi:guanine deaminase